MDLYKDILIKVLQDYSLRIPLEGSDNGNPEKVVESVCYHAIQEIRTILDNRGLDDFECIERIVVVLEEIGSNGLSRHDFG